MKQLIGNDIVDLDTSEAQSYPKNARYVKRVLCEGEQKSFFEQNNSTLLFWIFWSAKESVYKIIKKNEPNAIFSHRLYECKLSEVTAESASGFVTYMKKEYPVHFTITPEWVHCIASSLENNDQLVSITRLNSLIQFENISFSTEELPSIHSKESFLVRCLMKNLMTNITGEDFQIQRPQLIKKFAPPELWLKDNKCTDMDISMSHDGRYCAGVVKFPVMPSNLQKK